MKLYHTPSISKFLFPDLIWNLKGNDRSIYLTFDDGPVAGVTEFVLDVLDECDAKATFFCVGENIQKYPDVFRRIIDSNHTVGNHTHNHLNGWVTSTSEFLHNVSLCDQVLRENGYNSTLKLFRPPYGRLTLRQLQKLKSEYKIVMWDILSMDFDNNQSPEQCLKILKKHTSSGSVVVLHDSLKTENKIKFVLPGILDFFKNRDFNINNLESYFMKKA